MEMQCRSGLSVIEVCSRWTNVSARSICRYTFNSGWFSLQKKNVTLIWLQRGETQEEYT